MTEEFLDLIYRHLPGVQQNRRDGMPQQMGIHALAYASRERAGLDDRLHRAHRIPIIPVGFEEIPLPPPVQMGTQFLRECRQNRHIPFGLRLAVTEIDLGRVSIEMQVLDPDVHELIDTRPAEEQRLHHEPVCTVRLIGVLDEPLHLAFVQPGDRAAARAQRPQPQPTPHLLHDVLGLVISQVILAPEPRCFLHDIGQSLIEVRVRVLTTHFASFCTAAVQHEASCALKNCAVTILCRQ